MKTFLIAALTTLALASVVTPVAAYDLTGTAIGTGFDWTFDGSIVERRKPRIPGGSGCDSPRDLLEHPECGG